MIHRFLILVLALVSLSPVAFADPVEDNSFLVEEAYNQEPGVVQFINVWQKDQKTNDWGFTFTNEIPVVSQSHQFSYELPLQHLDGNNKTELSDIKLNYRYEIIRTDIAVATVRTSIIVPTGDDAKGFGSGATGLEGSMMASVKLSDKFVEHWNVGAGITPDAMNTLGDKADNSRYFWGFSHVYLYTDKLNFMLELAGSTSEETTAVGATSWSNEFLVSPSIRYAIDHKGWQYVPGIAFPIAAGESAGQNQVVIYLSIEGKMF